MAGRGWGLLVVLVWKLVLVVVVVVSVLVVVVIVVLVFYHLSGPCHRWLLVTSPPSIGPARSVAVSHTACSLDVRCPVTVKVVKPTASP